MTKKYKSKAMGSIHEMISDLHDAGLVNKVTMRQFDAQCLTPVTKLAPRAIRSLRQRERASQAVFARHLNVPVSLISQWERGEKRPNGPSLKLLALVKSKGLDAIA